MLHMWSKNSDTKLRDVLLRKSIVSVTNTTSSVLDCNSLIERSPTVWYSVVKL